VTVSVSTLLEQARESLRDGRYRQAVELQHQAFRRLPRDGTARDAATALVIACAARLRSGELEAASELNDAAIEIASRNDFAEIEAECVYLRGMSDYFQARYAPAEAQLLDARQRAARCGDERLIGITDNLLGIIASIRGDTTQALLRYGSAYAQALRLNEQRLANRIMINVAMAHEKLGEYDAALNRYSETATATSDAGEAEIATKAYAGVARIRSRKGDTEQAREAATIALRWAHQLGMNETLVDAHRAAGIVERDAGNYADAERELRTAAALAHNAGDALGESEVQLDSVAMYAELFKFDDALRCLNRAMQFVDRAGSKRDSGEIQRHVELVAARFGEVIDAFQRSKEGQDPDVAEVLRRLLSARAAARQMRSSVSATTDDTPRLRARVETAIGSLFELGRELRGGMSHLYMARDKLLNRDVVIKVLPEAATPSAVARFRREMELMATLQHPCILPVLHAGVIEEMLYYVMPFVPGESLRQRLDGEAALPIAEARRILMNLADALAFAHSRAVIHRDIKPENVLLRGGQAVLADFGIARMLPSEAAPLTRLTATGLTVGTPGYMAPEQIFGDDVDARADVYALGVVAFEMLAGQPLFTGQTANEIFVRHLTEAPPALRELRPEVSAALAAIVARALEKRAADRFANGAEFALELANARE
jgi:tetratricopeptide (TPR) repeat protein